MEIYKQNTIRTTKDKGLQRNQRNRIIRLFSIFIITLIIISISILVNNNNALAASGVRIYNYTSKKEYDYTSTQVKVNYNGKRISVDNTPGLIENGIALVSYKDIFARSEIKADCVYDKPAGTVSITKFGTTIVMKIGSKTAHINGKAVTAPLAPVKIKYVKDNVTKILVPSRFVFENLGYNYSWDKNTSTVSIEHVDKAGILLSYNDEESFQYTGTLGNVTIDGKIISPGNMPTIITNNTAMLRAKRVFADSKIKADYKFNSKDQSITLSREGNVLKMTIGSPVAYFNNKEIVLDTAPMIVTNHNAGASFVMVPGSLTASYLGYDYRWDRNSMTSVIISRKDDNDSLKPQPGKDDKGPGQNQDKNPSQPVDKTPDKPVDKEPELGDSPVTWDKGTILQQWEGHQNIIGKSTGVHGVDRASIEEYAAIYSIYRDYSTVKLNSETYAITASSPFNKVTSEVIGRQISIHIDNMNSLSNTYNLANITGGMIDTIRSYNAENMSAKIDFNVLSDKFSYDLSLSSDKYTMYVTIYYNSLNKVTIGTNKTMDYITLKGNDLLDVTLNQVPGFLTIELPNTKKSIDDQFANFTGGKIINYVNVYHANNNTYVHLGLTGDSEYYIVEDGNNYTIMFPSDDKVFQPIIPDKPKQPDQPAIPQAPEYPNDTNFELIIPNPAGLSLRQINDEDQYSKLKFSIRLPGDYISYFSLNPVLVNSNVIKDVAVFLNSDYETEILISTTKLQGYEIFADQDFIYVNIANPRDIYKNIVVLDPGHGGPAPGAHYNNTSEKIFNFKILYEIGKDYFNNDPSRLKVYYTRESDVDMSLKDRAAFAKTIGADLFVSLHMNANTNTSVYGTEVYYSSSNNRKNSAGLNSEMLAKIFVNSLSSSLKTRNRGTRAARYTVVHNNTVPAVLLELAFMSNKSDYAKITDETFQHDAAWTIYQTLLDVFEQYPTGR